MPAELVLLAKCESFAKEDSGWVDHHVEDTVRFEYSDELSVKYLRHVIAGTVFQTNVGQSEGHLLGNSGSQVEHGKGVATRRQDGASPELDVARLQQQTTDTYLLLSVHTLLVY